MESMYPRSPLRSTLNTSIITGLDMCSVRTKAVITGSDRSSPLRSTLNTNIITGLDMFAVCTEVAFPGWDTCKECTEAVHCVAL